MYSSRARSVKYRVYMANGRVVQAIVILLFTTLPSALSAAEEFGTSAPQPIRLQAQPVEQALLELAESTGVQIMFVPGIAAGRQTTAIDDALTVEAAIDRILSGSGLTFSTPAPDLFVITRDSGNAMPANAGQAQTGPGRVTAGVSAPQRQIDEIIVAGSRLGLTSGQLTKQILVLDAEQLEAIGEPTLGRALARVPHYWGGAHTTGAFNGTNSALDSGLINFNGAELVNLRGIGTGETLVLVNGKRLGAGDMIGSSSDIAGIPIEFVERVDVVLEGASAIYGADAVGGVVNIVLRQNYEGIDLRLEAGAPTGGGMTEARISAGAGRRWSGGSVVAGMSLHSNDSLLAADIDGRLSSNSRSFSLAPVGVGESPNAFVADRSTSPVTVLEFTQIGNGYLPSLSDFAPGLAPNIEGRYQSVVPEEERISGYLNLHLDVTDTLSLRSHFLYTRRDSVYDRGPVAGMTVLAARSASAPSSVLNPWDTDVRVRSIFDNNAAQQSITATEQSTIVLAAEWSMFADWTGEIALRSSHNRIDGEQTNSVNSDYLLGSHRFNPWGDGNAPSNRLPTDPANPNGPTVFDTVFPGDRSTRTRNTDADATLLFRGSLIELPAGDARMAIGATLRRKELAQEQDTFGLNAPMQASLGTSVGLNVADLFADERLTSVYAESLIPLLKSDRFPGKLSIVAAVRRDDYDVDGSSRILLGNTVFGGERVAGVSFGDTTRMSGLIWSPSPQFRIKVDRSTAFVAPTALAVFEPQGSRPASWVIDPGTGTAYVVTNLQDRCPLLAPNAECILIDEPVTDYFGGNTDLNAQASVSTKYGVEWSIGPDLHLALYSSHLDYRHKIVSADDVLFLPGSWQTLSRLLEFDGEQLVSRDLRTQNISREKLRTIDLRLTGTFDLGPGETSMDLMWTRQRRFDRFLTGSADETPIDLVGIRAPRDSALLTVRWQTERWDLSWSSSYRGTTSTPGVLSRNGFWETYEASLRHNLSIARRFDNGLLKNGSLALRIANLTDESTVAESFVRGQSAGKFLSGAARDPRGRMLHVSVRRVF